MQEEAAVQTRRLLEIRGKRTVDSFHRELGKIMWDYCGMARNAAGLSEALERFPGCGRSSGGTSTCPAAAPS